MILRVRWMSRGRGVTRGTEVVDACAGLAGATAMPRTTQPQVERRALFRGGEASRPGRGVAAAPSCGTAAGPAGFHFKSGPECGRPVVRRTIFVPYRL